MISLHLRRGTPLEDVIDQIQGIQEMQPFWNNLGDGRSVAILGLGDGIAHILKAHLKAREQREAEHRGGHQGRRMSGSHNAIEAKVGSFGDGPASLSTGHKGGDDDGDDD